ncbi:LVIVD repeat-containing protein [Zeaxanthinibacter enoshimensis]|uniref:LVIVD repeat-containing protein n=1 Tax=Zeaxanthinibacter enoshimensis TaxID=392009 RepID=A0A4R6TP01_9FLAO|nr:hypothetical protein [Zeaxanthinibacter enoshimensis]TDQ31325.1 hypothetical protein CLV82_2033 [Zeaxanthinibacter enoshimensis]
MFKKSPLLAVSVLLLASACSDQTTVYQDNLTDNVITESDAAVLQPSVSFEVSGVLDIYEDDAPGNAGKGATDTAGNYPLSLVAQVSPPNNLLKASHVDVEGDFAYVSYNVVDEAYSGAIEIINISNPHDPRVTSRLIYSSADINALQYYNGNVYAVGGVDALISDAAPSNSFIAKIPVSGGVFSNLSGIIYGFQQGFTANDVFIHGDQVLVTSGKDGSLTVYRQQDLRLEEEFLYPDLRSISVKNEQIALLDAGQGVKILDKKYKIDREIDITTDFGESTKKTLKFHDDRIMVSEASKGTGVYSFNDGALLEYIPILVDPEGVNPGDQVTNAVDTNDGLLMMANGGAGLSLTEIENGESKVVGVVELKGSINYVASKGDYIFAASGSEGLQIIKMNRPAETLVERCSGLSEYTGSDKFNVDTGETVAFSGAKRLNHIVNKGALLLCGSWSVRNNISIEADALMELNGMLIVARNNNRKNLTLKKGATLKIEGELILYGDLNLDEGATLEFLGDSSVVSIFGNVNIDPGATVKGNFEDIRGKF